jgi:hydroxymethylpyrimidine pyrophosphatase-like HAD family hydrolase
MTPTTAPTPTIPGALNGQTSLQRCMVALDIDGTLTAARREDVPKPTAAAVAAARRAGHHIVLSSGRSLAGILPIARALDLDGVWAVASNGGVIAWIDSTAPDGYTVVDGDAQLVNTLAVTTAAAQLRLPSLAYAAESIGIGYFVTERFPVGLLRGTQTEVPLTVLEALDSPRMVLRAVGVHDLIRPLRAVGLTATPAESDWLDVTKGGVSKATALETVRQRLGVAEANTVAVGDGINDLEALNWAARGVAMGHAPAKVRAAANEVTGSLEQHGVIAVLRSLPHINPTR